MDGVLLRAIFIWILYFVIVPIIVTIIYFINVKNINKDQETKVLNYRKKHPRCRYCIFLKKNTSREFIFDGIACGEFIDVIEHECVIKSKRIKLNNKLKGCFCKYCKPKELIIDEI